MSLLERSLLIVSMILLFGCAVVMEEQAPPPAGGKVAVCHKGKKTMYVDEAAVKAHLGHGDYLGHCK